MEQRQRRALPFGQGGGRALHAGGKVGGFGGMCGRGRGIGHLDDEGRLRADYKEMAPEVQGRVVELWPQVTNENLYQISDLAGYKADFLRLFGFGIDGVDYDADVNPDVKIDNLADLT